MSERSEKYEPIMQKVLAKIRIGGNYEDLYAEYGKADVHEALGRCIEAGAIPNATAKRNELGSYQIDFFKG